MKMNLDMSFEEGLKVVEALRECAINNGWEKDELDDSGIMDEYAAVVDAALIAMGITVNIDKEPKVEDEDEHCDAAADCYFCNSDEDEDDKEWDWGEDDDNEEDDCMYSLTPKGEFVARALELGVSFEGACELASLLFDDNKGE